MTHRWLGGIITISEWNYFQWDNSSISPPLVHELQELLISYIQKGEEEYTFLRSGSMSVLIISLVSFRISMRSCCIAPWNQGGATAANYVR